MRYIFPPIARLYLIRKAPISNHNQLPMEEITEDEIQEAIFAASLFRDAGIDSVPVMVWHKIWPVIKTSVTALFRASVSQEILPEGWKIAKIIPLRKPQMGDYTNAESFRPISLLPTLSKALESVIARRLSFLVEDYGLLPDNHFGRRKKRSTLDALMILEEKIVQAWRDKKVLSLVTFDVKRAFNGVAGDILLERLRHRHISETLICWSEDFLRKRQATITVNNSATPVVELHHAGLPQGSPLSPILFLFFNVDLVESEINKKRGAIAFIDDYLAWVTGDSLGHNINLLQDTTIPYVLGWAKAIGAVFQAKKTQLSHFMRNKRFSDSKSAVDNGRLEHCRQAYY